MGEKTGYKIRIGENAGSQLRRVFLSTNPWGTMDCAHPGCVICAQGNVKIAKGGTYYMRTDARYARLEGEKGQDDGRGVYVGESARSLYEKSKEHESDKEGRLEESHQVKHWVLDHPELNAPPKFKFKFKLISSFKDSLTRQISDAVRIKMRGVEILNSKSEFNRCRVPRLRIDLDG